MFDSMIKTMLEGYGVTQEKVTGMIQNFQVLVTRISTFIETSEKQQIEISARLARIEKALNISEQELTPYGKNGNATGDYSGTGFELGTTESGNSRN